MTNEKLLLTCDSFSVYISDNSLLSFKRIFKYNNGRGNINGISVRAANIVGVGKVSPTGLVGGYRYCIASKDNGNTFWVSSDLLSEDFTALNSVWINNENCIIGGDSMRTMKTAILQLSNNTLIPTFTGAPPFANAQSTILDIKFVNDLHGYEVGFFYDANKSYGLIYETNDGGATWHNKITNIIDTPFFSLYIIDDNNLIVGTNNKNGFSILKSYDGGCTWYNKYSQVASSSNGVNRIVLSNAVGIAVAGSGELVRTEDYGETWQPVALNTTYNIYGCCFNNGNFYIVGASGLFMVSSDGGKTWSNVNSNLPSNITYNNIISINQ
ncbi:MAG: YCF48-related protein [Phycisphaerales bacterium]|nr:YCF48-related protein [Phycisphaerales bacterium]